MPRRLLVALLAVLTLAACDRPAPPPATPLADGTAARPGRVVHVVDGDTVDLRLDGHRERARLLGIDTPETVKPHTPVQCYGPEASARTKALLPEGTPVLVQRDREARDRYGRLLVYLWRSADRLFVNESLLRDGYARVLSIAPNTTRRAQLGAAAAQARGQHRGLWGTCPVTG